MSEAAKKTLPHQIGIDDIANPELKRVAMLFMENFKAVAQQIKEVSSVSAAMKRVLDANGKSVMPDVSNLVPYSFLEITDKTANPKDLGVIDDRIGALGTRLDGRIDNIKMKLVNSIAVVYPSANIGWSSNQTPRFKIPMAGLVDDTDQSYSVTATFVNAWSQTSGVSGGIRAIDGSGNVVAGPESTSSMEPGDVATTDPLTVSGNDYLQIKIGNTSVSVFIKVYSMESSAESSTET